MFYVPLSWLAPDLQTATGRLKSFRVSRVEPSNSPWEVRACAGWSQKSNYVLVDASGKPLEESPSAEDQKPQQTVQSGQQSREDALDETQKSKVREAIGAGGDSSQLMRLLAPPHAPIASDSQQSYDPCNKELVLFLHTKVDGTGISGADVVVPSQGVGENGEAQYIARDLIGSGLL
eukprot:scaffold3455_cov213-Prasinococcus_capsulatus_cf.AAC.3